MMIRLMTAAGWPAAALVCVPWLCPTFATAAEHNGTTAQCTYPRHTLAEQGRTQQQHRDTTQSALDQRPVQTRPCHLRPVGSSRGWKVVEQSEAGAMQRPMVSLLRLSPNSPNQLQMVHTKATHLNVDIGRIFLLLVEQTFLWVRQHSEGNLSLWQCYAASQTWPSCPVCRPFFRTGMGGRPLYSMVST